MSKPISKIVNRVKVRREIGENARLRKKGELAMEAKLIFLAINYS
jgi:hypothetical protein